MRVRLGQLSGRALLCLLPLTFVLLLLPVRLQNSLRFTLSRPLVPIQRLLGRSLRAASRSLGYGLIRTGRRPGSRDLSSTVANLQSQVLKLRAELAAAERKLRALGRTREKAPYPTIYAEVIGADPTSWRKTWLLGRGRLDEVREDMPAVWGGAAVGRISAVGRLQSRLMLLSDPRCRVAVKSARSGAQGILEGTGGPFCRLKYLSYRQDLREGDLIVTSGADGIFPPEYVVGECVRVSADTGEPFQRAEVRLLFSPARLEGVVIIETGPFRMGKDNPQTRD